MTNYKTINGIRYNLNDEGIASCKGDILHAGKHGYWIEITGDRLYTCEDGWVAEGTCIIPLTNEDADWLWHIFNKVNAENYVGPGYDTFMCGLFSFGDKRNTIEYKCKAYRIF